MELAFSRVTLVRKIRSKNSRSRLRSMSGMKETILILNAAMFTQMKVEPTTINMS